MGSLRYAVAAVLLAFAVAAPAAGAATRYASPDGSGPEPCAEASPCALEPAIEGAVNDDEVIVKSGTYGSPDARITDQVLTTSRVNIHGEDGKPRPVIYFNVLNALVVNNAQAKTRWLHIDNQTFNGLWARGTVEQVYVQSNAGDACAVVGGLWRNSVCRSLAANSAAASLSSGGGGAASVTLRNVTAWATGANSVGVRCDAALGSDNTITVMNSILQGSMSDARAQTDGSASTTCAITVNYSNYNMVSSVGTGSSVTPSAGNQNAAPLLRDAAGGDFHQLPGSPTIGAAQISSEYGTADLDGDQREVSFPDIGADEFTPAPVATTGDASATTSTGATVSSSVDPNFGATTVRFDYGTTDAYGASTPDQAVGNGADPVNATATLSGLAPSTTYHYRVVATSAAGTSVGVNRTFTTAAPPQANPDPDPTPDPPLLPPAPVLSGLKASPKVFAIGSKLPALLSAQAKPPIGTELRFTLNVAVPTKLIFYRLVPGRRVGTKCRAPSRSNVGRPKCTRRVKAKPSVPIQARAGLNRVRFQGRLDKTRRLGLGRHEVAVVATDLFGRSAPVKRAGFRIVRR